MHDLDPATVEQLKEDCATAFNHVVSGLGRQSTFTQALPNIRLGFINSKAVIARMGRMPGNRSTILLTISEHFLKDLHHSLMQHAPLINCMMELKVGDSFDKEGFDLDLVLEAIYDLALQFVMHHELFHLLCGHLNLLWSDDPLGHIDETLSFGNDSSEANARHARQFYFQEVEADNSSLIWIIEEMILGSVNRILNLCNLVDKRFQGSISTLHGGAKVFAYKLLFIAFWIVVSLVEGKRIKKHSGVEITHPLPAARILAGIHTLIEFYVEFMVSSETTTSRFATVGSDNIIRFNEFVDGVTGPFCIFFRNFSDATLPNSQIYAIEDFDFYNGVISIVRESNRLLMNEKGTHPGSSQLDWIETVRTEMYAKLKPYRYMEDMLP